jgi:hypothetical protein
MGTFYVERIGGGLKGAEGKKAKGPREISIRFAVVQAPNWDLTR